MRSLVCVLFLLQDVIPTVPASAQSLQQPETLEDVGIPAELSNKESVPKPKTNGNSSKTSQHDKQQEQPSLSPTKLPLPGHTKQLHQTPHKLPGCQMHIQFRTLSYGDCSFFVRVKTCEGYCSSGTVPYIRNYQQLQETSLTPICYCCQPLITHSRTTTKNCKGKIIQFIIPDMRHCACRPCAMT